MTGKIVLASVVLLVLPVLSCNRGCQPERKQVESVSKDKKGALSEEEKTKSVAERISLLMNAPIESIGQSRETIKAKLGPWRTLTVDNVPNRHDPNQVDSVYDIGYDGLMLKVYKVGGFQKEMLVIVRMTKNYPGILPQLIGLQQNAIELRYGPGVRTEDQKLEYTVEDDFGVNSVSFVLGDGKVAAVQWAYYTE